ERKRVSIEDVDAAAPVNVRGLEPRHQRFLASREDDQARSDENRGCRGAPPEPPAGELPGGDLSACEVLADDLSGPGAAELPPGHLEDGQVSFPRHAGNLLAKPFEPACEALQVLERLPASPTLLEMRFFGRGPFSGPQGIESKNVQVVVRRCVAHTLVE